MVGLRNPVGDHPPEVYWKRRLVVGVGLAVIIFIIWALIATNGSGADKPGGTKPTTEVTTTAVPTNATDALARACGASDVTITTTPNPSNVAAGALPVFDVTLAQTGASACLLDTSAKGTELLIMSGKDRIYSSKDCPKDKTIAAKQLILEPGANDDLSITWNRERSAAKCADVAAKPGAGTYKATLTLQGIKSEAATFTLE